MDIDIVWNVKKERKKKKTWKQFLSQIDTTKVLSYRLLLTE